MIEAEKLGVPAIPLISGRFEGDAIASSRAFGMPELKFVVVPRIYRNLAIDECISQTEEAFDDIVQVLTDNPEDKTFKLNEIDTDSYFKYKSNDKYECSLLMNRDLLDKDISDGFPVFPATRENVDELLSGTSLSPDDVICDMPPGFGIATIEKIAINAAYAGAKPEHMPVIIAAVKAFSLLGASKDPLLSGTGTNQGKSLLMSTSPQAPLLIVNGPIANKLGINSGSALGPGKDNEINIVIGRAFYLCLKNIGYWYPNEMDMDSIGTTRKFVQCIAENESMSPWDPFHVDLGYGVNESTVSVFVTDGELDVQDQGNTSAEDLLKVLAYGCSFGTANIQKGDYGSGVAERLILMPPDVANPIGADGEFSKQKAREFIHNNSVGSLGKMTHYMPLQDARVSKNWQWIKNLSEEQRKLVEIPIMDSPDDCYIVVVGADRAKTAVFPSGPAPSTVRIDDFIP